MGHPIGVPTSYPSAGTSSATSLGTSTGQDSIEDYHEIRGSIYDNLVVEACRISMMGPGKVAFSNSSSRYPTIKGSEASDARTPSNRVVQNLNPDFNVIGFKHS
jgi:hypothetical protein